MQRCWPINFVELLESFNFYHISRMHCFAWNRLQPDVIGFVPKIMVIKQNDSFFTRDFIALIIIGTRTLCSLQCIHNFPFFFFFFFFFASLLLCSFLWHVRLYACMLCSCQTIVFIMNIHIKTSVTPLETSSERNETI